MFSKLNKEQLEKLALYTSGINTILMEALKTPPSREIPDFGEFEIEAFVMESGEDNPFSGAKPQPVIRDYDELDRYKREQALSRLCGRWTMGANRCDIKISRAGEHFVLTYLKRNGNPSDERYILVWLDGDIFYYGGNCCRVTVLALNAENDTLMISPGADYTRVPEEEKK